MTKYFDKLESVRGLAAFAVALYHSPFYLSGNPSVFVSNAYLFVDFFFVLSGFVMANAYRGKIAAGFKFRDYFWLRLGRIYPLHLSILAIWALYIFFKWILFSFQIELINPLPMHGYDTFLATALMVQSFNLFNYVGWNYPAWSVSVEFYTYFIFFAFAWLVRRRETSVWALILCLASYFYLFHLDGGKMINFTISNGIFRCTGGFFAGVFLYEMTKRFRNLGKFPTISLEIAAVASVYWFLSVLERDSPKVILMIPVFVLTVYIFSLEKDGFIGKLLKLKPFADAGKYSYSVYLTHALILDFAFSLTKYFILKPTEEIFYFQTRWTYLINPVLALIVFYVSKFTYIKIEKKWIERAKEFIEEDNFSNGAESV